MRSLVLVVLLGIAACYDPRLQNCTVTCEHANDCASGQVCGADKLCAAAGVAGQCAAYLDGAPTASAGSDAGDDRAPLDGSTSSADARVSTDARTSLDAAPAGCQGQCPGGTCVAGVCEITCGDNACASTVQCPAGVPCRVVCSGKSSCAGGVRCEGAAGCDIECSGKDSCANELRCGTGTCAMRCTGRDACPNTNRCPDACACDVQCSGMGACRGASECPAAACDTGLGCSSLPAGCRSC